MTVYVLPTVLATGLAALFLVPLFAILHWDNRRDDAEWKRLEIAHEEEVPRWHAAFRELCAATENWYAHRGVLPGHAVLRVRLAVLSWLTTNLGPGAGWPAGHSFQPGYSSHLPGTEAPKVDSPAPAEPLWQDREPFALWLDDAYVTSRGGA